MVGAANCYDHVAQIRTDQEESNDSIEAYLRSCQHCQWTLMLAEAYHSDGDHVILGKQAAVRAELRSEPHSNG